MMGPPYTNTSKVVDYTVYQVAVPGRHGAGISSSRPGSWPKSSRRFNVTVLLITGTKYYTIYYSQYY